MPEYVESLISLPNMCFEQVAFIIDCNTVLNWLFMYSNLWAWMRNTLTFDCDNLCHLLILILLKVIEICIFSSQSLLHCSSLNLSLFILYPYVILYLNFCYDSANMYLVHCSYFINLNLAVESRLPVLWIKRREYYLIHTDPLISIEMSIDMKHRLLCTYILVMAWNILNKYVVAMILKNNRGRCKSANWVPKS